MKNIKVLKYRKKKRKNKSSWLLRLKRPYILMILNNMRKNTMISCELNEKRDKKN